MSDQKIATELEWLTWFYSNCDFGPAHEDVMSCYQEGFEGDTGMRVPEGYRDLDASDRED